MLWKACLLRSTYQKFSEPAVTTEEHRMGPCARPCVRAPAIRPPDDNRPQLIGPCSPRVRSAMRPPRAAYDKPVTDGEPSRRPGLCCPAMENAWPDNIEPLRAGLTDEEFADLLVS